MHRHSLHFQIVAPLQNLFSLFTSKSPEIKVNQTLFYKVNLTLFESHAFDCNIQLQQTGKDTF